jgi:hypothetical protein
MITGESVERACSEVGEYTDEHMVEQFDRFFRAQPAICEFIIELTQDSGQKIQELSLFLSYIVFKAIEIEQPGAAVAIKQEEIEAAYQDTESWMAQLSQARNPELQATIAENLNRDTEPFLLQYVISELNEPMEDGTELNDEEKGEVFFILKTVIASIDQRPRRRIIEVD